MPLTHPVEAVIDLVTSQIYAAEERDGPSAAVELARVALKAVQQPAAAARLKAAPLAESAEARALFAAALATEGAEALLKRLQAAVDRADQRASAEERARAVFAEAREVLGDAAALALLRAGTVTKAARAPFTIAELAAWCVAKH